MRGTKTRILSSARLSAAVIEDTALAWVREILDLPKSWGGGFVTGTTMGNFSGLAAGRHAVLEKAGWDVEAQGLFGAPEVQVVVGAEAHTTLLQALALVGFGRERVVKVPVDGQGRMRADRLPKLRPPSIVCLQAGNVNTGSFDPVAEIAARARDAGAWIHLDGAFGLWAAASPETRHLTEGIADVDSIATDLHKWLNVPYDNGLALYRDPEAARQALSITAAYLPKGEERQPCDYTPESSRRARGVEIWAALLSLGRSGLRELIERHCRFARRFADGLHGAGYEILNDVVLNQVLVLLRKRRADRARHRCGAGRGHVLVQRHHLERPGRDAHQRLVLGNDRRGRRKEPRSHRGRREGNLRTLLTSNACTSMFEAGGVEIATASGKSNPVAETGPAPEAADKPPGGRLGQGRSCILY